ncbi:MAG: hypothetical protein KDD66_03970 [Bdellovibrionales bacterium]|nr:hypothetical protein [Bdellovibrionales bacterium]
MAKSKDSHRVDTLSSSRGSIASEYAVLLSLLVIALYTPITSVQHEADQTFRSVFDFQTEMTAHHGDGERESTGHRSQGTDGGEEQHSGQGNETTATSGGSGGNQTQTGTGPGEERMAGGGSKSTQPTTESSNEYEAENVDLPPAPSIEPGPTYF